MLAVAAGVAGLRIEIDVLKMAGGRRGEKLQPRIYQGAVARVAASFADGDAGFYGSPPCNGRVRVNVEPSSGKLLTLILPW